MLCVDDSFLSLSLSLHLRRKNITYSLEIRGARKSMHFTFQDFILRSASIAFLPGLLVVPGERPTPLRGDLGVLLSRPQPVGSLQGPPSQSVEYIFCKVEMT